MIWTDVFRIIHRKKIGGGPKVYPADQFTWFGCWRGRHLEIVTTVKDVLPDRSFLTFSSARINYNPTIEHFIEFRCQQTLTAAEKTQLLELANTVDNRPKAWR